MRDVKTYEELKQCQEYRDFRKKNIVRSLFANGLLGVFWVVFWDFDNLSISGDMRVMVLGVLVFVTFFMLRFLVRSLFLKPKTVFEATILEIREKKKNCK